MHANHALILTAALFLSACDEKSDTGDTPLTDDTTDDMTPMDGPWYIDNETILEDTCGFTDDDDSGDTDKMGSLVVLTMIDASTFTFIDENDSEGINLTCTLEITDSSFDCGVTSEVSDFTKKNIDAVLTLNQALSGAFSSSTTGTVNMVMDVSCEGSDCDMFSKKGMVMPCNVELNADVSYGG